LEILLYDTEEGEELQQIAHTVKLAIFFGLGKHGYLVVNQMVQQQIGDIIIGQTVIGKNFHGGMRIEIQRKHHQDGNQTYSCPKKPAVYS